MGSKSPEPPPNRKPAIPPAPPPPPNFLGENRAAEANAALARVRATPHNGKMYQADDVDYLHALAVTMGNGLGAINPQWFVHQAKLVRGTLDRVAELESELTSIREELAHMRTTDAIQDRQALLENNGALEQRLTTARKQLEQIVCTEHPDDGVVLLSNDGPCHWDAEAGCQVYDHEHFSPLGDALIALHKTLSLSDS